MWQITCIFVRMSQTLGHLALGPFVGERKKTHIISVCFETVWMRSFKLLMIASTGFHVFKPVLLALPLSEGDRDVRKVKQFVFSLQVLPRPKCVHVLHGLIEMYYWFSFLPFLCWSKSRIVWSTCISQVDVSGEGFKIFLVIFRSDWTPDHSHAWGMWDVLERGRGGHSLIRGPGVRTGNGGAAGSVGSDAHTAASGVGCRTASFAGTDLCIFLSFLHVLLYESRM